MPDRPTTFSPIELLPGLLGAAVGYMIGDTLRSNGTYQQVTDTTSAFPFAGALIGFLIGLAFVALMHWVSRLCAKKPPPPSFAPTVPDEAVWPPPIKRHE